MKYLVVFFTAPDGQQYKKFPTLQAAKEWVSDFYMTKRQNRDDYFVTAIIKGEVVQTNNVDDWFGEAK